MLVGGRTKCPKGALLELSHSACIRYKYLQATAGELSGRNGQKLSIRQTVCRASATAPCTPHACTAGPLTLPELGTRERAGPGTASRRTRADRGPRDGNRDGPPGRAEPRDRPGPKPGGRAGDRADILRPPSRCAKKRCLTSGTSHAMCKNAATSLQAQLLNFTASSDVCETQSPSSECETAR